MTEQEIREIFSKKYKDVSLEGCVYLQDLNLYELIIDFNKDIKDPHSMRLPDCLTCIDGNTKEITYLHFEDYLSYDGPEIDVFISKRAEEMRAS